MRWSLHAGDLLDVAADGLVCSANVHLNLCGGVGGAFALRYGPAMQKALHAFLARERLLFVRPGEVIEMPPCGSPYRFVLHAVAVDAVYETSPELVANVLETSLRRSAALGASSIALAALGTGYGRLTLAGFAKAFELVASLRIPPVEQVIIGLRSRYDAEELLELAPALRFNSPF